MIEKTFITEDYIKKYTPLSQNISAKDIYSNVLVASDLHTQPLLGTNFYNYLLTKYDNKTLSDDEIKLVEYIQPSLAYRSASMTLPFLNFQIKNKGIQTQNGDNSDSVDKSVVSYLKNELDNRAEFYEKRLINYLCDNKDLYPNYTDGNDDDIEPKNDNPYTGGFTFY
tara:strand:+ start:5668 stop:6171 length:504 start_codon:yes stop_codon:yes gene_type:complete